MKLEHPSIKGITLERMVLRAQAQNQGIALDKLIEAVDQKISKFSQIMSSKHRA